MVIQEVDNISFEMQEAHDFSFLREYGRVFCVFSRNDSGNISFGTDDGKNKYFIKVAGAKTAESSISTQKAIENLMAATPLYIDLEHPHLIQLVDHFPYDDLYIAAFKWVEGDCLFDFWNFEKYASNHSLSPGKRFRTLCCEKRLNAFDRIFDFLAFVESQSYVAVDFYDGSIMYDFQQDVVTICDIDFFRKHPVCNDMGEDFWGT